MPVSATEICTLGELERAVAFMNADFDGSIRVIYSRNGKFGFKSFTPDGTVGRGIAVVVQMDKPGYASRIVGRFRVTDSSHVNNAPLQSLGSCPAMRWVILCRLLTC
jgi:hypothetical protein